METINGSVLWHAFTPVCEIIGGKLVMLKLNKHGELIAMDEELKAWLNPKGN